MSFRFTTGERGERYVREIADAMSRLFQISIAEAEGRINAAWDGLVMEEDDLIFHETPDHWAHDLYYGHNSKWWLNPPDLKPLPYP